MQYKNSREETYKSSNFKEISPKKKIMLTQNETKQYLDFIIMKLIERSGRNSRIYADLSEADLSFLCTYVTKILKKQNTFLNINTPLTICGDIHGQFLDLLRIFNQGGYPHRTKYLFLGDYVDRGNRSIETIALLFAFKIRYPENFFILRGNHESISVNKYYGFYKECKRRYSFKLWELFNKTFDYLPIAALIDKKIFCTHGGLSPELFSFEQIKLIERPCVIPNQGLLCDLLWSDPNEKIIGWEKNDRGVSFIFGKDVVIDFLKKFNLELICRAHQVVKDGFKLFGDKNLVTVFSAPNYGAGFFNTGAMLNIDRKLLCRFNIIYPTYAKSRLKYNLKV